MNLKLTLQRFHNFIPFVVVAICLSLFTRDLYLIYAGLDRFMESWNATEVFISYDGGFVRRGLLGSILFGLSNLFQIDVFVFSTTVLVIVALVVLLKLNYLLSRYGGLFSVILLSMVSYGSYLNNHQWFRKDLLIILLFIGFLETKSPRLKSIQSLLPFLALLIHELSFFIFILPIFLQSHKKNIFKSYYLVGYLSLTCLIYTIYHGNEITAGKIWANYQENFAEFNISHAPLRAIEAIGFSSSQGLDWSLNIVSRPLDLMALIFLTFLVVYLVGWLISIILQSSEYWGNHFGYALIYFLPLSMMFILGWDYNRWISIYTLSAVCFFSEKKWVSLYTHHFDWILTKFRFLSVNRCDKPFGFTFKKGMYLVLFILLPYPLYSGGSYFNQLAYKIVIFFSNIDLLHL